MLTRLVLLVALALGPAAAGAAPSACPQHFADGKAPTLVNEKLAARTRALCYSAFAVLHSGGTRTPLWSAEHLMRAGAEAARATERHNAFPASHLPTSERAELKDYARSGFDRSHLAPSGDGLRYDRLSYVVHSLLRAACIFLVARRLARKF